MCTNCPFRFQYSLSHLHTRKVQFKQIGLMPLKPLVVSTRSIQSSLFMPYKRLLFKCDIINRGGIHHKKIETSMSEEKSSSLHSSYLDR